MRTRKMLRAFLKTCRAVQLLHACVVKFKVSGTVASLRTLTCAIDFVLYIYLQFIHIKISYYVCTYMEYTKNRLSVPM